MKNQHEGGEGMLQAYRTPAPDEAAKAIGREIVEMLVTKGVTYREAEDALEYAQTYMMESTTPRPVTLRPGGAQTP